MELTTQCPQCGEVFQASLEQLQLRKGYVRCINCAHIFDGYEAVLPSGAAASDRPSVQSACKPAHHAQSQFLTRRFDRDTPSAVNVMDESQHHVQPGSSPLPVEPSPLHAETAFSVLRRREPVVQADVLASPEKEADENDVGSIYVEPRMPYGAKRPADIPEFLDDGVKRYVGNGSGLWWVLSLMALLVLAAQMLYVYRVQLADHMPALRPILERLCLPLDCSVGYPRRIDAISILSSSLRVDPVSDPVSDNDSALVLHMTLRNADDRPLQWPSVLLDLTDFAGAVVVRRALLPEDYLPSELRQQQAFAARTELAVQIPLQVRGSKINGYQLSVFYP